MADSLSKLPEDVLLLILSKLPSHSLLQLKSTSKFFNFTISRPYFLRLHLSSLAPNPNYSLLSYDSSDTVTNARFSFANCVINSVLKDSLAPFSSYNGYLRLVGCVKGVVCLFDTNYHSHAGNLILWNPLIGRFKIVPNWEWSVGVCRGFWYVSVGFGFDCKSLEFKVVKILYGGEGFRPEVVVYGLGVGGWRRVKADVPCYLPRIWCGSVVVNGVVHWLAYDKAECRGRVSSVMCFDVVDEVFTVMGLPGNLEASVKEVKLCDSVEKSLTLLCSDSRDMGSSWGVWVMREYGKVDSWTKIYNLVVDEFVPLAIVGKGRILVVKKEGEMNVYDAGMDKWENFPLSGLPLSFHVTGYTPSLVLLDIGERLMELTWPYWDSSKRAGGSRVEYLSI